MQNFIREEKKRINLLINYDLSKTLTENVFGLNEQFTTSDMENWEKEVSKKENLRNQMTLQKNYGAEIKSTYPNYCSSPKNAVKGFKNKIEGYCYYPRQKYFTTEPTIVGIWIPQDAKIEFWTIDEINNFAEKVWVKYYNNKKENKKTFLKNISNICPINSVASFSFSGQTYVAQIRRIQDGEWVLKGFVRPQDLYEYEEPTWVDTRTPRQIFVDNWGTVLQWAAVFATIAVGAMTGGASWALAAEIILQGGIGGLVAHREFEKGENVSGVFSLITGVLPFLKVSKNFRGINTKILKELSDDLSKATISSPDEMLIFYNSLSAEKQKTFSKIFLQDQLSEDLMVKMVKELKVADNIPWSSISGKDELFGVIKETIKSNKEVFKNLAFWDKLWARELTFDLVTGILDIVVDASLGRYLNDYEKQQIEWVYAQIPESHKKEFIFNLANNPEQIENISKQIENSRKETITAADEYFSAILKHEISSAGRKYVELPDDPSNSGPEIKNTEKEKENLRKNGWVPKAERNNKPFTDVTFVGDELWFKVGSN